MNDIGSCDRRFDINGLLADWLSLNNANHLMVITGKDSEMKDGNRSTYSGLWKDYFAGIWNQSFADRAVVCDYNEMGHEAVLKNFYSVVNNSNNGSACPQAPNSSEYLTEWNP